MELAARPASFLLWTPMDANDVVPCVERIVGRVDFICLLWIGYVKGTPAMTCSWCVSWPIRRGYGGPRPPPKKRHRG